MRKTLVGLSSLLLLTGCGQSVEASLNETCSTVMADPDVQRDILEANDTLEAYCSCTSKQILAMPEADRDTATETMAMVA